MPLVKGETAVFSARVAPAAATGTVTIFQLVPGANSIPIGTGALTQGVAAVPVQPSSAGTFSYEAQYSGDTSFSWSGADATISVMDPPSSSSCGLGTAVYVLNSGIAGLSPGSYSTTIDDQSAICAQGAGTVLNGTSPVIAKTAGYSYTDDPSGIGAAVLAYGNSPTTASGATINLSGNTSITATQAGYAAFASGNGATINLTGGTVTTLYGKGLGAAYNGSLNVADATVTAAGDPLEISLGGSAVLQNTALNGPYVGTIALNGPTSGTNAATHFRMTGGSISFPPQPAFGSPYPAFSLSGNQTVDIYLSGVDLSSLGLTAGDAFMEIGNGSSLSLTLDHQAVTGSIAYATSVVLQNGSTLDGNVLADDMTLDASSSWTTNSSTSFIAFNDPGGISGSQVLNVTGNGQSIGYSNAANPQLGGLTYTLQRGGTLKPY
jgi:hypothetical protein